MVESGLIICLTVLNNHFPLRTSVEDTRVASENRFSTIKENYHYISTEALTFSLRWNRSNSCFAGYHSVPLHCLWGVCSLLNHACLAFTGKLNVPKQKSHERAFLFISHICWTWEFLIMDLRKSQQGTWECECSETQCVNRILSQEELNYNSVTLAWNQCDLLTSHHEFKMCQKMWQGKEHVARECGGWLSGIFSFK